MPDEPLSPDGDPFYPPTIPTLVHCLHCNEEYDSYRIEWRIETTREGTEHGFWCCPVEGCDGRGFGFDILPVDPNYRDERGGWFPDDDGEDDEEMAVDDSAPESSTNGEPDDEGDEKLTL